MAIPLIDQFFFKPYNVFLDPYHGYSSEEYYYKDGIMIHHESTDNQIKIVTNSIEAFNKNIIGKLDWNKFKVVMVPLPRTLGVGGCFIWNPTGLELCLNIRNVHYDEVEFCAAFMHESVHAWQNQYRNLNLIRILPNSRRIFSWIDGQLEVPPSKNDLFHEFYYLPWEREAYLLQYRLASYVYGQRAVDRYKERGFDKIEELVQKLKGE